MLSINCRGNLLTFDVPRIMGILNVTTDSFFAESRRFSEQDIASHVQYMLENGADIIDVGACSTRPDSKPVEEAEEVERLKKSLPIIRRLVPENIPISVDTFRSGVAKMCVEKYGVTLVNDISGGKADKEMFRTVAQLNVPYVLTYNQAMDEKMPAMTQMLPELARQVAQLREYGVNDVIIDPGFGFQKTLGQNYDVMNRLELLHELQCPLLVGISRKSMIHKLLHITPDQALNGTTVLHTVALQKGAHILRVHDVREAVECVRIVEALNGSPGNSN